MNEEDFMDLVRNTRLSKASRDAARLVFVEGMSQAEAGATCDLSKQRMSAIVATVRRAEQERQTPLASPAAGNELVAAIDASYAFAVKAARDEFGDQVQIGAPTETTRAVGPVVARTDFHLVQSVGRDAVIVHDLAKLDKVPAVGKSVAIQYENGRGVVAEKERQRGVQSR